MNRQSSLIMALFLFFSASLQAETGTRIAVYDTRAIYRAEAIYQKIHLLHVKKEVKTALNEVDKKSEGLLMKIVSTDDPAEIRTLQNQMSALKKINKTPTHNA